MLSACAVVPPNRSAVCSLTKTATNAGYRIRVRASGCITLASIGGDTQNRIDDRAIAPFADRQVLGLLGQSYRGVGENESDQR
jgi:hypothetical protein